MEATGETVGEAKWKALRDLERSAPGLDKSTVRYQVVSEGERGLLGVGYTPARVIASGTAPDGGFSEPPEDESAEASRVRALVERVVGSIGVGASIDIAETDEEISVTCTGGDVGLLIGKHGQTIDALQYVANAAVFHRGEGKRVTSTRPGIATAGARRSRASRRRPPTVPREVNESCSSR